MALEPLVCLSAVECFVLGGGPPESPVSFSRSLSQASTSCGCRVRARLRRGQRRGETRRGEARQDETRQDKALPRCPGAVYAGDWLHRGTGPEEIGWAWPAGEERILARASKRGLDWTGLDSVWLLKPIGSLVAVTPSFTGGTHQTSSLDSLLNHLTLFCSKDLPVSSICWPTIFCRQKQKEQEGPFFKYLELAYSLVP